MGSLGSKEITNSAEHKGLENKYGENTCFLNVVIQSLWHLRSFRERLLSLDYTHIHRTSPCVFCSLVHVFTQYKFSETHIIPAKDLRRALHDLYRPEHKFRLGDMCDAEECFDAIVKWLHCEQVALWSIEKYQDIACVPSCISHTTFGAELCDIRVCTICSCTSDPEAMNSFVFRVYTADLLSVSPCARFGKRIFKTFAMQKFSCPDERDESKGDAPPCPPKCAKLERWCFAIPEVFTLSLIWPGRISNEHAKSVISSCISMEIDLLDVFRVDSQGCTNFKLCGMMCFAGTHYVSLFWSSEHDQWLLINDTKVTGVGNFDGMLKKVYSKRFQPTVLFYEKDEVRERQFNATMELAESMSSSQMFTAPEHLLFSSEQSEEKSSQHNLALKPTVSAISDEVSVGSEVVGSEVVRTSQSSVDEVHNFEELYNNREIGTDPEANTQSSCWNVQLGENMEKNQGKTNEQYDVEIDC